MIMGRMAASVLVTTLSSAVTADAEEGISLLQMQAHLSTREVLPDKKPGDFPEPKKQSKMSGEVEVVVGDVDFTCDGGKGKWVYMNEQPSPKRMIDISQKTTKIQSFLHNDYNGQIRSRKNAIQTDTGEQHVPEESIEHGAVKDEKDCYNRAKQDYWCNHWAEDQVYSETAPVLGVFYGGVGWSHPPCICGNLDGGGYWGWQAGKEGSVEVANKEKSGIWYCKFMDADRMTDEPKAKKEPVPDDFSCDLCADSDNEFDPTGKKGKCKKINERAQKSPKACEKRKKRTGVQKRCCPDPPVECPLCPDGKEFKPDNLGGKCATIANKATKNQEVCDKMKARKRPQRHCCKDPTEDAEEKEEKGVKDECTDGVHGADYSLAGYSPATPAAGGGWECKSWAPGMVIAATRSQDVGNAATKEVCIGRAKSSPFCKDATSVLYAPKTKICTCKWGGIGRYQCDHHGNGISCPLA